MQDLPNGNGVEAASLFIAGQEGGTTEMRDDFMWVVASTQQLNHPSEVTGGMGGTVRGRTP